MTAVLGGDEAAVLAAIAEPGSPRPTSTARGRSWPAARSSSSPRSRPAAGGARLRPLRVAGAFHTGHMAPAVDALARGGRRHHGQGPGDHAAVQPRRRGGHLGADFVDRIVDQVANPVRWDPCMATMTDLGVTAMIELPPGGTLTGIAKRALPGVELSP